MSSDKKWITRKTALGYGQDMSCFLSGIPDGGEAPVALSTDGEAIWRDPSGECRCAAGRGEPHRHQPGHLTAEQVEEAAVAGLRAYLRNGNLPLPMAHVRLGSLKRGAQ